MKTKLDIFEEMQLLEYNISHPKYEIIHEYYRNGFLRCLNEMFDILELGSSNGVDPEYIFGDETNKVLLPQE
jgi:hypothetical protein